MPSYFREISSEKIEDQYDLRKLLAGSLAHTWIIAFFALIFCLLGLAVTLKYTHIYYAETLLLYRGDDNHSQQDLPGGYSITSFQLGTAMEAITIRSNLRKVKENLNLNYSVDQLENLITVIAPPTNSFIIRVKAVDEDPDQAIRIANEVAKIAEQNFKIFGQKEIREAVENTEQQLTFRQNQLNHILDDIDRFQKDHPQFVLNLQGSFLFREYGQISSALQRTIVSRSTVDAEYKLMRDYVEKLPDYVTLSAAGRTGNTMLAIANMELRLAEYRAMYTEDNPKVIGLVHALNALLNRNKAEEENKEKPQQELNPLKQELSVSLIKLQGRAIGVAEQYKYLLSSIDNIKKQLEEIPGLQMEYTRKTSQKKIVESNVSDLNAALQQLKLLMINKKGILSVFNEAERAYPLRDSFLIKNLWILSLLFGLFSGLFFSTFLEIFDNKLYTPRQVEIAYTIPCILAVPENEKHDPKYQKLAFARLNGLIQSKSTYSFDAIPFVSIGFVSILDDFRRSRVTKRTVKYLSHLKKTLLIEVKEGERNITLEQSLRKEELNVLTLFNGSDFFGKTPTKEVKKLLESLQREYGAFVYDFPETLDNFENIMLCSLSQFTFLTINTPKVPKYLVDNFFTLAQEFKIDISGIILLGIPNLYVEDMARDYHRREYWFNFVQQSISDLKGFVFKLVSRKK